MSTKRLGLGRTLRKRFQSNGWISTGRIFQMASNQRKDPVQSFESADAENVFKTEVRSLGGL